MGLVPFTPTGTSAVEMSLLIFHLVWDCPFDPLWPFLLDLTWLLLHILTYRTSVLQDFRQVSMMVVL